MLVSHEEIFGLASSLSADFLLTYDDAPDIRGLARQHRLETVLVPMQSTKHQVKHELLIGRNLNWAVGGLPSEFGQYALLEDLQGHGETGSEALDRPL